MSEREEQKRRPPRAFGYDDALIERLAEHVYRRKLGKDAERMVEKDGDDGAKLRRRAMAYAPTVRATLDALLVEQGATSDPTPDATHLREVNAALVAVIERAQIWMPEHLDDWHASARAALSRAKGEQA